MNAYLKAMRLERWPRSLAIYFGCASFFFLSRESLEAFSVFGLLWRIGLSFILTWAISTANYIINEIVDLPYDIHHPTKRFRPLVQGEIRKTFFFLFGLGIAVTSLLAAYLIFSLSFFLALISLLLAGFIYNLKPIRTKDIPFLDSISESANNPIRFFIGWYAFAPGTLFPPLSLLLCWWSFGNFFMVAKRLSEFRYLKEKAENYRASHKRYSHSSLLFGMVASALIFFLTYFYFARTFKLQSFFYLSPFLLVFFILVFRKTLGEAEVMEEPEKLLVNPKFALYTLFLLSLFTLSFFFDKVGQ
ncbi:MAG: UbiA family prenyltransferase [Candidatus Aminicenantales bacterium]